MVLSNAIQLYGSKSWQERVPLVVDKYERQRETRIIGNYIQNLMEGVRKTEEKRLQGMQMCKQRRLKQPLSVQKKWIDFLFDCGKDLITAGEFPGVLVGSAIPNSVVINQGLPEIDWDNLPMLSIPSSRLLVPLPIRKDTTLLRSKVESFIKSVRKDVFGRAVLQRTTGELKTPVVVKKSKVKIDVQYASNPTTADSRYLKKLLFDMQRCHQNYQRIDAENERVNLSDVYFNSEDVLTTI